MREKPWGRGCAKCWSRSSERILIWCSYGRERQKFSIYHGRLPITHLYKILSGEFRPQETGLLWTRFRLLLSPFRADVMLVITFGGKRKESLQLRLWNLNICIEKVCCEMRIGGDDISNDVITLGTCFPLRADWWKSDSSVDREPQGNRKWNSTSGDVLVANSPFFSRPAARAPRRACSQASISRMWSVCVVSWV